jgi:YesN/AraC family two-component response regulator
LTETDTLVEFKGQLSHHITEMRMQCGKKKPKENICEKLKLYLEENYSDTELSVNVIGQRMGMQPAHLSKLFKESYGISIADYLALVRIQEAKRMMREMDMSVQETAEKTGFISSHAFIRMFKKLENMTPGKYRETCKK